MFSKFTGLEHRSVAAASPERGRSEWKETKMWIPWNNTWFVNDNDPHKIRARLIVCSLPLLTVIQLPANFLLIFPDERRNGREISHLHHPQHHNNFNSIRINHSGCCPFRWILHLSLLRLRPIPPRSPLSGPIPDHIEDLPSPTESPCRVDASARKPPRNRCARIAVMERTTPCALHTRSCHKEYLESYPEKLIKNAQLQLYFQQTNPGNSGTFDWQIWSLSNELFMVRHDSNQLGNRSSAVAPIFVTSSNPGCRVC